MLKNYYYNTPGLFFSVFSYVWKHIYTLKNCMNLITPLLFWTYLHPQILYFLYTRKYFFFKFFTVKKFRKVRFKKFSHLSKKQNAIRLRIKRPLKANKVIRWFTESLLPLRRIKKKSKWLYFVKRLKRWQRGTLKRFRKYTTRKNFLRCLKQRIELSQNFTGKLLFGVKNKNILKKLFKLFVGFSNRHMVHAFFTKHHYFSVFHKKLIRKYGAIYCNTNLLERGTWYLTHFNLNNLFFFRKKKMLKLFPFNWKRYNHRFFGKKFNKRKKWYRRKLYRRQKKNFINYYKNFKRFYVKVNIIHKEPLSNLTFNNTNNFYTHNYYLNYIINIWNIRSYNWKQIT